VQSFLRAEYGQGSSTGENQVPLRIPFAFSKVFFYAKLVRDPTRSVRRRVKDVVVHTGYGTKLRLHIHSQPRLLITLSGIDGSGKTTQAHALQSAFHVCHLHANHVWSRGGSARWLQLLRLRRKSPAEAGEQLPQEQKVRLRQERFRSRWLRWGWSWLTAIELLLKYTREVTLPLLLGRVVICDRYIYDTFADWAAYFREPVHERLAARLLRLLTPTPAVRYWLDVPAELAQKRSPEQLPANFLQAQANAYRQMTAQHGLQRREGASSKDEVADQIVYEVLSRYFADYRTIVNALFLKNPGQWR
jgi:dTMP kinase